MTGDAQQFERDRADVIPAGPFVDFEEGAFAFRLRGDDPETGLRTPSTVSLPRSRTHDFMIGVTKSFRNAERQGSHYEKAILPLVQSGRVRCKSGRPAAPPARRTTRAPSF